MSNTPTQFAKHSSTRRRLAALVVATVTLMTSIITQDAPTALAANNGRVMCVNQAPVVGVWVNVSRGTSGWAGWSTTGVSYSATWSYNTQGKPYSLTVGCGGTPAKWASSSSTPVYSTNWVNIMCYPGWSYGLGTIFVKDRCYAG